MPRFSQFCTLVTSLASDQPNNRANFVAPPNSLINSASLAICSAFLSIVRTITSCFINALKIVDIFITKRLLFLKQLVIVESFNKEIQMKDIAKGLFLGVCFFVIPLTVWVIKTGGL